MQNKDFLGLFKNKKPIIGMLHLKGSDKEDRYQRFLRELDIYVNSGIDGVIVETYFGPYSSMEQALNYLAENKIEIPYGVNCLNVDTMGFYAAEKYNADFIQIDSVVGHVKPRDEETVQAFFDYMRPQFHGAVIGGVRFKYQPMLSANSVEQDLEIAKGRCDGICVTQDRTGQETSLDKIKEFKAQLQDFPLIVAAGVTPENVKKQLKYADAAIVGSYFKDNYQDNGELCQEHISKLLQVVEEIRSEQND